MCLPFNKVVDQHSWSTQSSLKHENCAHYLALFSSDNGLKPMLSLLGLKPLNSHHEGTNYFLTQAVTVFEKQLPQHFSWIYAPVYVIFFGFF